MRSSSKQVCVLKVEKEQKKITMKFSIDLIRKSFLKKNYPSILTCLETANLITKNLLVKITYVMVLRLK